MEMFCARRPTLATRLVVNRPVAASYRIQRMSLIKPVTTTNAPAALQGVYEQAIIANGFVYCSGQIHADKDGKMVEGDIQAKTAQCITNLKAVLEAAGTKIENVVKVNVFLSSMDNFSNMNEMYIKMFANPKPARSCVAVRTLPKGAEVEIECIAVLPKRLSNL